MSLSPDKMWVGVKPRPYNVDHYQITSCRKCGGRGVEFKYIAETNLVMVICKVCGFKYEMYPWDREEKT